MQGIFVNGRRPLSKKAIMAAVVADPNSVTIEATSYHGGDYNGPASGIRRGSKIYFVGPDPYTSRRFYGSIIRREDGTVKVS